MKRYLLLLLTFVTFCAGAFADDASRMVTFAANGDCYSECSKSFVNSLTVYVSNAETVATPYVENEKTTRTWPHVFEPTESDKITPLDQEVTDTYEVTYVTTDGSNPGDSHNPNRICVWGKKGPDAEFVSGKPVTISGTSVVRAATVTLKYIYKFYFKETDWGGFFWNYEAKLDRTEETVHTSAWQSYICTTDLKSATPTIEMEDNGVVNVATKSFITSATAKVSCGYQIPDNLQDYFSVGMSVTENACPSATPLEECEGNNSVADVEKAVYATSTLRAQVYVYASHCDDVAAGELVNDVPVSSDEAAATFTKLELTDAQQMIIDKAYFVDDQRDDSKHFGFTYGLNVKNIEYDGNTYSVLTDGKSSFLVKNRTLMENEVYFVGGNYSWGQADMLYMLGFGLDNSVCIGGDYNQHIQLTPTMLTEENMIQYIRSVDGQPLVDVAFPVKNFVASNGSATVGSANFEIVNIDDITAAKTAAEVELYDGKATVSGIVFGQDMSGKFLVYADDIMQSEQITFTAPEITIKKEKNVDSTKDQTARVDFSDSYTLVNENLDAANTNLDVTVSLRTSDGKVLATEDKQVSLSDPAFDYEIPASAISPDLEYVITVDKVVASNADNYPIAGQEYANVQKSFTTVAPKLLNQSVSVFDGAIIVPVLNVESVDINDADEIKLYNNATGEEVEYKSVSALDNEIVIVVGNGGIQSEVPYADGLHFGQYTLVLGAEALNVDEFVNPKELSMEITAGNEVDKARINTLTDIDRCYDILAKSPRGVNIFQYLPVTCAKFQDAIDEAASKAQNAGSTKTTSVDELNKIHDNLLAALYDFQPSLPEVNETYTFRTNEKVLDEKTQEYVPTLGKYFNIEGEKVVLSDEPSYVQFHMVENCYDEYYEALTGNDGSYGSINLGKFSPAPYTWYLYNTKNRSYVYTERVDSLVDGTSVPYIQLLLTDNRHIGSTFTFGTGEFNEWIIKAVDYVFSSSHGTTHYDAAVSLVYYNDQVSTSADYSLYMNKDFMKIYQQKQGMFAWYIEQADQPEEEVDPADGDSEATVITSVDAASMNATFYTVNGAKLQTAQKGLNIAKLANGNVKKVYVK